MNKFAIMVIDNSPGLKKMTKKIKLKKKEILILLKKKKETNLN